MGGTDIAVREGLREAQRGLDIVEQQHVRFRFHGLLHDIQSGRYDDAQLTLAPENGAELCVLRREGLHASVSYDEVDGHDAPAQMSSRIAVEPESTRRNPT